MKACNRHHNRGKMDSKAPEILWADGKKPVFHPDRTEIWNIKRRP